MIADLVALPEGVEAVVAGVLLGASFVTSFVTVAFGIGGGGLLLAVMATLVPTPALIPVHGLVQLGSNAGRALLLLRSVFWPALPGFAAGSVVGSAVGGAIVVELPVAFVQIGVGLFVIWTVFARPPAWLRTWPALAGLVSSFLTMFFGATGLFVASYTKAFALPRHDHVATHATLMTLQHALKVAVFGLLGFAFAEWGVLAAAMILTGAAGTLAGRLLLDRLHDRWFRLALDTLLVLIALRLVASGIASL